MYQNRLENIVQIIEVQNTKLLENKQKELPEPKETIIDYEDNDYYDYDEDLDNKKENALVNASLKVDINKKEGLQKYDKIHFRKEVYFYYGNKRTKI